ncbi:MAG: hypothetical protein HYY43_00180 [Deltaproteobacteria bacterium]|nr:hypothetical protein [Deltaproteobacteria bacterium]
MKIFKLMFLSFALLAIAACSDTASTSSFKRFTVWGKVVDLSTQAGVSGATVKVYVGTEVKSATTSSDNADTTDYNEAGDFQIQSIPDGTHRLRVVQSGYAVYEEWLTLVPSGFSSDNVSYYYAVNGNTNGRVNLSKGCDVSVYVTSENGSVVSGATVYGISASVSDTLFDGASWKVPELTAVTDSTGLATLSGLSQVATYDIYVPAYDSDSDGTYNYQTTLINNNYGCDDSNTTVAGVLTAARRDDTIAVVAGSFETDNYPTGASRFGGAGAAGQWGFSPSGTIQMVFNYPIETVDADAFVLTYSNDLVLSTAGVGVHDADLQIPLAAALSAGNTILTLTPTSPVANESYELMGAVSAVVGGERQFADMNDTIYDSDLSGTGDIALQNWYAFNTADFTTANISADNYNDSNTSGVANTVYLEFPEYVYGTATVVSTTDSSATPTTTLFFPQTIINLSGGAFVIDEDAGDGGADLNSDGDGCRSGTEANCTAQGDVVYRVTTGLFFADSTATVTRQITVVIDATDYEGNHIQDEVTLSVQ